MTSQVPTVGRFSARLLRKISSSTGFFLWPEEKILWVARLNGVRPMTDALIATSHRIIAINSGEAHKSSAVSLSLLWEDFVSADMAETWGGTKLLIRDGYGREHHLPLDLRVPAPEAVAALREKDSWRPKAAHPATAIRFAPDEQDKDMRESGDSGGPGVLPESRACAVAAGAAAHPAPAAPTPADRTLPWQRTIFRGKSQLGTHMRPVMRECAPGEEPWFVINTGAGVLAAFEDRCLITTLDTDSLAGIVAAAQGNVRALCLPYSAIEAVEIRPRWNIFNTVYEVEFLTVGRAGGLSAHAGPFARAENTLLFKGRDFFEECEPLISKIRQRLGVTRVVPVGDQGRTAAASQSPGSSDIASQLYALTELHRTGALTDDEFAVAKARLLG
ncbi:hypothetical protein ACFC4G_45440 [Streptomyces sp. NPDC056002]|uniref:hypothetical protein n=1 Tax=Streptomyces sp. NPDC056002 TaxID=3345675 RepID=UPI0035DF726B